MTSRNNKTYDTCRLLINLTDKINLKRSDKYVALSSLSTYKKYNNFEISALTWNEEFELPYGSYSVSDIWHYFEYILTTKRKDW